MKCLFSLITINLLFFTSGCKDDNGAQSAEAPPTTAGYSTPDSYPGMTLLWRDEFDGDHLNLTEWKYDIGGNGWGNHELEYYQEQNTTVSDGYLFITARKENAGGENYTSSRIKTEGKKEFQYGRVDIRALVPKGQGIWPALWMLGSNISSVGWPACGEIDVMEMIGGEEKDNTLHGTAHWDNAGTHASNGGSLSLANKKILADEFHVFSIEWTPTHITWYLDDAPYHTLDTKPQDLDELNNKFFFIFNVAVGGDWPGSPDTSTRFPQQMVVDYIRVFQQP